MDCVTCVEAVTLVHHVREKTADSYICYPMESVSWYEKMTVAVSGDGAKPVSTVIVRIPEDKLPEQLPQKLDYIVKGAVETINSPRDLKGHTYFQITSISDNCRGNLPHMKVSGV